MTEEQWQEIIADKFELLKEMVSHLESDLKKEPGKFSIEYINPLVTIVFEATMDLKRERNRRIDEGGAILRSLNPDQD
jgi:hypothetical protein